jgi:predicted dehydrogenase
MPEPLKIAVAGLGRMGQIHALHAAELARETQNCELAGLADLDQDRARRIAWWSRENREIEERG